MPVSKRQNERLIAVFIIGVIALNYPLLSLFSKVERFLGVPVLYLYLFLLWLLLIAGVAIIVEKAPTSSLLGELKKSDKHKQ